MSSKRKKIMRGVLNQKRKKQASGPSVGFLSQDIFKQALSHHQAGRLPQAEALYRGILALEAEQPETLLHLGILAHETGKGEQAVALMSRALACRPDYFEAYYNLGIVLFVQGKLERAVAALCSALTLKPDYSEVHNILGNALMALEKPDEAAASFRQALSLNPDYVEAHYNLGNALIDLGHADAAAASYRQALTLMPDYVEAHYNLGIVLQTRGKPEEAAASYRQALALKPDYVEAHNNLGNALLALGKPDEAAASFSRAVSLRPDYGEGFSNLGYLYYMQGKIDEAVFCYKKAVELNHQVESAGFFLSALTGQQRSSAPSQYVINLFDNYAERFDNSLIQNLEYQVPELLRRLLDRYLPQERTFANVLDLGCGTGLSGIPFRAVARKMVGVDLSGKMLAKAEARGIYHSLYQAELLDFLTATPECFDLIVAADVFIYVGDLALLFKAASKRLTADGLWLFSTEKHQGNAGYILQQSGRFAHSTAYIEEIATLHNLNVAMLDQSTLRKDKQQGITGNLYLLTNCKNEGRAGGDSLR